MADRRYYTDELDCEFCGSAISITTQHPNGGMADAAAEAIGWATFDKKKGKQDGRVCPDCIESARAVVRIVGPGVDIVERRGKLARK